MKLASIIIPTYTQANLFQKCLESIQKHTNYPYEIIVVINGCADTNPQENFIARFVSRANKKTIIKNPINLGFPKAINQGIKAAQGDYIAFLNDDIEVTENWLTKLVAKMDDEAFVGMVGASRAYRTLDSYDGFVKEYVAFFCALVKREVIDKVGLLDEAFGLGNWDDIDYAIRVKKAGYELAQADLKLVHHGSMTYRDLNIDDLKRENKKKFEEKWGLKA